MNKTFVVLCDYCSKEIVVSYPPMDMIYACDCCEETRSNDET